MRFEVPQFIEVESQIFGPFTWKQFIYLSGGVGLAVVLFLTSTTFMFALFGIPAAGLGLALAFYRVNDRPFSIFLESFLMHNLVNTKLYLWSKQNEAVYDNDPTSTTVIAPHVTPKPTGSLNSLSRKLELQALQEDR